MRTYLVEGQLRGLHRRVSDDLPPYTQFVPYHSFKREDGQLLVPGEVAKLAFGLQPISVRVKKGHCLRIAIAGADKDTFPRIPTDVTPVITIARNAEYASHITLPVQSRGAA